MTKPIGVIFDMDGVIFDTESIWKKAFEFANVNYNLNLSEEYRQSTCGKNEIVIRDELRREYPSLDVDAYRQCMLDYVRKTIETGEFAVKSGFVEVVRSIRSEGILTAIATSSHRERAEKLFELKGIDIDNVFDAKVFSEDVGKRAKPDPYIFLLAAERLGASPKNCFVIEDSINGIVAAYDGGFSPIMLVDLIDPDDYCRIHAKAIIHELNEIPTIVKGNL